MRLVKRSACCSLTVPNCAHPQFFLSRGRFGLDLRSTLMKICTVDYRARLSPKGVSGSTHRMDWISHDGPGEIDGVLTLLEPRR